jgi:hypothetical protein
VPVEHAGGVRGFHSKYSGHASLGAGAAGIGIALAEHHYTEAGQNAAMLVALNPKTYKAAAALARDIEPVAKTLGFVGKKVPVVGDLVTLGYVGYEVGDNIYHGHYGKAAAALGAGTAELIGGLFGFGAGDVAREAARQAIVMVAGEKYAPNKSGLRQLGESAIELARHSLDHGQQHPQAQQHPVAQQPHPQQQASQPISVAPSIYHYKNLPAVAYVLKDTPSVALNGHLQRTPDGFIKNLRDLNMADPKNLKAFEDAIHRRMHRNDETIKEGEPYAVTRAVSSFLGLRDGSRKVEDARIEQRQLQNALRELESFKRDVHAHNGTTPAAHPPGASHPAGQGGTATPQKQTPAHQRPRQPSI